MDVVEHLDLVRRFGIMRTPTDAPARRPRRRGRSHVRCDGPSARARRARLVSGRGLRTPEAAPARDAGRAGPGPGPASSLRELPSGAPMQSRPYAPTPPPGIDPRGPRFGAAVTARPARRRPAARHHARGATPCSPSSSRASRSARSAASGAPGRAGCSGSSSARASAPPTELEDPRPPTFAQLVGLIITGAGLVLGLAGRGRRRARSPPRSRWSRRSSTRCSGCASAASSTCSGPCGCARDGLSVRAASVDERLGAARPATPRRRPPRRRSGRPAARRSGPMPRRAAHCVHTVTRPPSSTRSSSSASGVACSRTRSAARPGRANHADSPVSHRLTSAPGGDGGRSDGERLVGGLRAVGAGRGLDHQGAWRGAHRNRLGVCAR